MNSKQGIVLLVVAAFIATSTALAHLSCIYFGPQCYSLQMAPSQIVESAKAGSMFAPIATVAVSIVFFIFAAYALSGARVIRKLPLLGFGIYSIALLCVVRGLLPLQLWLRKPERVSDLVLSVGIVWLLVGLLYFFGYRALNAKRA